MTDNTHQIEADIRAIAEAKQRIVEIEQMAVFQEHKKLKAGIKSWDGQVRDLALEMYQDTGAKHPHAAVSVQMRTAFEYDAGEARNFALNTVKTGKHELLLTIDKVMMPSAIYALAFDLPDCLVINDREFIKELKSHPDLPGFVTETKEPFVKVASDLSEFVD